MSYFSLTPNLIQNISGEAGPWCVFLLADPVVDGQNYTWGGLRPHVREATRAAEGPERGCSLTLDSPVNKPIKVIVTTVPTLALSLQISLCARNSTRFLLFHDTPNVESS